MMLMMLLMMMMMMVMVMMIKRWHLAVTWRDITNNCLVLEPFARHPLEASSQD